MQLSILACVLGLAVISSSLSVCLHSPFTLTGLDSPGTVYILFELGSSTACSEKLLLETQGDLNSLTNSVHQG